MKYIWSIYICNFGFSPRFKNFSDFVTKKVHFTPLCVGSWGAVLIECVGAILLCACLVSQIRMVFWYITRRQNRHRRTQTYTIYEDFQRNEASVEPF